MCIGAAGTVPGYQNNSRLCKTESSLQYKSPSTTALATEVNLPLTVFEVQIATARVPKIKALQTTVLNIVCGINILHIIHLALIIWHNEHQTAVLLSLIHVVIFKFTCWYTPTIPTKYQSFYSSDATSSLWVKPDQNIEVASRLWFAHCPNALWVRATCPDNASSEYLLASHLHKPQKILTNQIWASSLEKYDLWNCDVGEGSKKRGGSMVFYQSQCPIYYY